MVARYPAKHAASVVIDTGGKLVNGEWEEGTKTVINIRGRFDHSNSSRRILKKNSHGDTLEVQGEYYTRTQVPDIPLNNAVIKIPGIGIELPIISWETYQMHSVIYV